MPYVNATTDNFAIIDYPFPLGFTPFWAQGLTFYEEDDDIISNQTGFDSFELLQVRLKATDGQCILKIGVDSNGTRLFGQGYFGSPSCPPMDDDRGVFVPDKDLPDRIPGPE